MQEGVGGIKPTEETYVREDSLREEAVSHVVGGSLRSKGTRRGLQRKGLLCHTALVARYARTVGSRRRCRLATLVGTEQGLQRKRLLCHTEIVARYARKELDGDYSEKDCCVTQR